MTPASHVKQMPSRYFASIDGLRAIAVVAVILNHLSGSLLASGFLGVDIFFVISGFVITNALYNRKEPLGAFLGGFYVRRIKRLYPALVLCLGTVALIFSLRQDMISGHRITGLFAFIGFSNVALYLNELDYWGVDAGLNPFTHTWSLGVEEQFYLIYPLVFWGLVFSPKSNRQIFASILLIAAGLSFAGFLLIGSGNPAAAFYLTPFRLWELAIGAIVFALGREGKFQTAHAGAWVRFAVLSMLIAGLFLPADMKPVTTPYVVIMTAMLLRLSTPSGGNGFDLLSTPAAVYVGKISYSLYLWHWPVIVYWRWMGGSGFAHVALQVLITAGLAMTSYHFVERPLRYANWLGKPYKAAALGSAFAIALATMAMVNASEEPAEIAALRPASAVAEELACKPVEGGMTIRLIGNSHAYRLLPVLKNVIEGCNIAISINPFRNFIYAPKGVGDGGVSKIDEIFAPLQNGDIIILSSRFRYLYDAPYLNGRGDVWVDGHIKTKSQDANAGLTAWLAGLDAIRGRARSQGVKVVLFMPTVEFDTAPLPLNICANRSNAFEDPECNTKVSRQYLNRRFPQEFYEAVHERAASDKNFFAFNSFPTYCAEDAKYCYRAVDGVFAFRDTNHLSSDGALLMAGRLKDFLNENNIIPFESRGSSKKGNSS